MNRLDLYVEYVASAGRRFILDLKGTIAHVVNLRRTRKQLKKELLSNELSRSQALTLSCVDALSGFLMLMDSSAFRFAALPSIQNSFC